MNLNQPLNKCFYLILGSKQCVAWILTDVIKDLTSEDGSIKVSMISIYSASVRLVVALGLFISITKVLIRSY